MELSDDTAIALEHLNNSIEGGLRKRNDIGTILELSISLDASDQFNELTRTGTAVWKVYSTLRRVKQGDEGFRQLEDEFARQMNSLREQLATVSANANNDTLKRFDEIYFGMTQGVVKNIVDLAHDLAKIKALQSPL